MKLNKAFTLIELLVVIAIISILAAVLFPVFATAREKAHQTTCASNLKQIALAATQYSQDYDEYIVNDVTGGVPWDGLVAPYVKMGKQTGSVNPGTLAGNSAPWEVCPDDAGNHVFGGVNVPARSYAMAINGVNPNNMRTCGQLMSKIPVPANTLLITEFIWTSHNNAGYSGAVDVNCPAMQNEDNTTNTYTPGLHSNGWNYSFVDGHVKWLDPRQTIGPGGSLVCSGSWGQAPGGMWTPVQN